MTYRSVLSSLQFLIPSDRAFIPEPIGLYERLCEWKINNDLIVYINYNILHATWQYLGEKDCANTWLVRALVSTTRISTDIHEILTVLNQHLVTPKCVGASISKINKDGVLILKQACSR